MNSLIKYGVIGAIVLVVGLFISPFTIVDPGNVKVVTNLGSYSRTLGQGIHWLKPFTESTTNFNVQTLKEQTNASAASNDLQVVNAVVAINYNLMEDKVGELYVTIGENYKEKVMDPAIQEVVKAVTARYNVGELITKRPLVTEEIQTSLKEKLASSYINVTGVSIVNFDFSPSFNKAIEEKVTAEQNALAEQNNLKAAQFKAQAIRVTSEAANNEKYIELQRLEVEKAAIEKWNGMLPTQMIPGATLPFINLSK